MFPQLCLLSILLSANGFVNSPKIITKDGNLIFESGLNRNISFRLHGSSRINVNDEFDLLEMLRASKQLGGRNTSGRVPGEEWHMLEDDTAWQSAASDLAALKLRVFGAQGIDKQLRRLQNRTRNTNQILRHYQIRVQTVETRVQALYDRLEVDNCRSSPCANGGTCFTVYNGFICKCTKNFEGPTCDTDVNECALFAGTDLGCQNGGQCVNQHGGYSCICSPGWFGIHCTQRKGDCLQSSAWELCGHGTCVSSNDNFGYKCICDQGWKTNGLTPACSVDVDECSESHPPCATRCINLPGSFTCASCPAGLTGSGVNCRDIDECAYNNGGCSTSPRVPCINTYSSFHCGECPLGFTGDGRSCVRHSGSNIENGQAISCAICHPLATCSEVSNTVVCSCPVGMIGSGVGVNGCIRGTAVNCNSNPCLNGGTCIDQGNSFTCLCARGFRGPSCTPVPSPCLSNPCLNSGSCVPQGGTDFRCQCAPGFTGRLCDNRYSRCGGILVGEVGHLKYPEGDLYGHNSQCAWVIRTNETLVLNVTFNFFDLEDATECRFDWLQINDGRTAAAQIIGRFCGVHKPLGGSIISTTNHLYLWFRSDNSSARAGFDLSWNSMKPVCGGLIEFETHGTIKTPGSPGNYPKNRDCIWQLRAPNTKRIKLAFFSLQIEKHDSCNFDFVEITDAISGVVLEKFCNSSNPAPIMLSTNEADIHFHSDNEGGDTGFQIHYSAEQRTPGCGGTFTSKEGTIRSPDNTQESISCEYEIKMAMGEYINVRFTKFELGAEDCIEIYDIHTGKQIHSLQGKYCGSFGVQPSPFSSLYSGLQLKFYSKGGTFELKYKAECSYNFESSSDVITSPNYPHLSNTERFCTFKIVTEPDTVISLHLVDFDMNDNSLESNDCAYTFLKIYDGIDGEPLGPFCGNYTPPINKISQVNALRFDFQTSITSYGKGFKIEYRSIPMEVGCGGVFTKPGYTIRLPTGDNGQYMNDMVCYWVIMAPRDRGIMLTWKSFNLEESTDCTYDYVEVYDNLANSENDKPLGRYCELRPPPSILSHSNILTLKFGSDFSDAGDGFEVTYDFVDYTKNCGGTIHASTGELNSPNWPLNYSNGMDCIWVITAPQGTQIELQFDAFQLEDADKKCGRDWLEIRNGGNANSSLVGFYCGTTIPHRIPSFTNQMYLHFHSDQFVSGRGFKLKWYIFSNGCGGSLNTDLGVITSPLYPVRYPNNVQCDWFVRVNPGSSIHFTVEDLAMEDFFHCNYDSLEIFDGRTSAHGKLSHLCRLDDDTPKQIITSSNEALVRFTTDMSNTERGFFLSYYANCTRTITALQGVIESLNYGDKYRRTDVNCTWTLKAPKGNRVFVEFTHFEASDGGGLYLTDFARNGSSVQRVLTAGGSFNSSGDTLALRQNNSLVSFRLEYTMAGCIEILHRDTGEFHSPDYPGTYPNNIECMWEIRTAPGHGIEVKILDMDIEESVNCTRDGLMISSNADSTNPKERHCGKQESITMTSSSHRLFMRFHSDGQNNGKGFHGSYTLVKTICGGEINGRNGVIQSPHYPQNYPPNSDCEWTVRVSPHHTITFTMEELDVEEYYDCAMDYVELSEYQVDGEERQLFKKCSQLEADSYEWTTTSNTAIIRFVSDSSDQAKGFKISFKENCGERIYIESDDLDFLELNKAFVRPDETKNETCIWELISKDPTKHVTFSAYHVQLTHSMSLTYRSEEECSNVGVKVYNGDDTKAPLLSKFCSVHPPEIASSGRALTVQIPLNVISEFGGYYAIRDDFCGNHYFTLRGRFSSPQYPSSYPVNIQCVWTMEASAGNAIALTIEVLDMEQSDDCNEDYLEVRVENERGRLLGIFCGKSVPPTLESVSSLWIKFRSNDDVAGQGFLASYSYAMHNELTGENGTIESPGYPTRFVSTEPYSWRITADREYAIILTITHVVDVNVPFIKFYDGYSDIGPQIEYADEKIVRSNTNILYITALRGPFSFEWHQVSKEAIRNNRTVEEMSKLCGTKILVVDTSLVFSSPGYPNGYPANLDCSWTIMAGNPVTHAVIQFITVDLEDIGDCLADYVRVSTSSDLQNWQSLGKHCKKTPTTIAAYEGKPYLKLDFVTDVSVNKTGFSAYLRTACGSELTDRSGFVNITSLSQGSGWFHQECVWTIRVRQGHRIRITFPESYLHPANNTATCNAFFIVRNGIDSDSPFLGKGNYCENDISDVLETSSNRAYVKFTRTAFPKFRAAFHYEEIMHECSDELTLSDATELDRIKTITSPKYPNLPNPHSQCVWRVVAPVNHVIALDFFDHFDLAAGTAPVATACDREYVQVNDGGTELMPLLGRFCGTTKPDTIYSTSNVLRITYFTDIAEPHMGFKANASIARCGGMYYTSEGTITSPTGLKLRGMEQEFECVFAIEVAQGSTINLTVENIDLPDAVNCSKVTHIELQEIDMYNSDVENMTDVLQICGQIARRYIVETNKLVIRYRIKHNPATTKYSFKLSYSAIGSRCGETIQATQGILQTPGYPGGVSRPTHCLWRIRVPKGRRVRIEFLDFDTGALNNGSRIGFDRMQAFRGRLIFANDFQMQSVIARVSQDPPTEVSSTDNTMAIDAFLLSFAAHRGFKLRFSSDEDTELCQPLYISSGGRLQMKRDNDNSSSIFCSHDLKMGNNETLTLHVEKFEKFSEYYNNHFCSVLTPLKLEFNSKDLLPNLLCNNETQPVVRLPFPVIITLSGNKRNRLRELLLQYRIHKCGGIVSIADTITINQPIIEGQASGSSVECAWAIWPNGYFDVDHIQDLDIWMEDVQLVVELATDFKGTCEDQYLLLYNGPDQNSPHLGRYCQQSSALNLVVERGLFFEYVTNNYDLQSTFNLSVRHGSGCGGRLTYPFRSIMFADEYKNNVECIWDIVATPGFYVSLYFVDRFFIESSPNCTKDYLRVQQKQLIGEWVDIQTICGRDPPVWVNSTTTEMRLIFRSDGDTIGDGFTAQFGRGCGGIFYASDKPQKLSSPGYPEKYSSNLFCNYTIIPLNFSSDGLVVRFLNFELEQAPISTCMFDNVTVYAIDQYQQTTETVLCGSQQLHEFRAKNRISVVLRTDASFAYGGFQFEYSSNLCGGVVKNTTVIRTPIQYHDPNFPPNSNCYWKLEAPTGHKILIKFEELDFESQISCTYDAVEVFQGHVEVLDQRLAKLCGNLTGHLPTISISSNTGLIHSFSDSQDASRGFRAVINFIPNCDKNIFLDTHNASYQMSDYAAGYTNDLDCSFVFSTLAGRQLQIEFRSFHVEETDNCKDDYLEVRDGSGPFADLIGSFCGHLVPATLISSNNAVEMHFVTDSQVTSAGFEAIIKSVPLVCGSHNLYLNTTKSIELKSPDDGNGKYLANLNCFWRIKADTNIHLKFEKFDLQSPNANGTCDHDYLKFYTVEDSSYINKGLTENLVLNGVDYQDVFSFAQQHIYCGNHLPDDYFATSKEILMKFMTDTSVEKSGFKIVASATSGCFRNFTGTQGRILLAENADHCDIYIRAPQNFSLSLYYSDTSFSESDCDKEYLEVFETKTNTSLQKDCGYIAYGRSLFTNHNELRLRIKLDNIYSQFDITYLASSKGPGCGGDLYNTVGLITSPFYPNNVRENSDCRWNIRVPSNVHVLLQFEVFDLGAKTTCHSDYVQIIEYNADGSESVMRQFCGEDQPRIYKSDKSFLTVRFHKTVNYDGTGWVLKFVGVYTNYKIPEYFWS